MNSVRFEGRPLLARLSPPVRDGNWWLDFFPLALLRRRVRRRLTGSMSRGRGRSGGGGESRSRGGGKGTGVILPHEFSRDGFRIPRPAGHGLEDDDRLSFVEITGYPTFRFSLFSVSTARIGGVRLGIEGVGGGVGWGVGAPFEDEGRSEFGLERGLA